MHRRAAQGKTTPSRQTKQSRKGRRPRRRIQYSEIFGSPTGRDVLPALVSTRAPVSITSMAVMTFACYKTFMQHHKLGGKG